MKTLLLFALGVIAALLVRFIRWCLTPDYIKPKPTMQNLASKVEGWILHWN